MRLPNLPEWRGACECTGRDTQGSWDGGRLQPPGTGKCAVIRRAFVIYFRGRSLQEQLHALFQCLPVQDPGHVEDLGIEVLPVATILPLLSHPGEILS
jgi:hypothetical protein